MATTARQEKGRPDQGAPDPPVTHTKGRPTTVRLTERERERIAAAARNASDRTGIRWTETDYMRHAIMLQLDRDGV